MLTHLHTMRTPIKNTLPSIHDPMPTSINPTKPHSQKKVLSSIDTLNLTSHPHVDTMAQLPNELWLQALELVPRSDLPNLSQTSKHFHKLVEPILYCEFDSTKHKDGPNRALVRLLRTMVNRPNLADHVKNITLRVMVDPNAERLRFGTLDMSFLTLENRDWMEKQMSRFSPTKGISEDWISIIVSETNWEGVAAFLLVMVSQNLRSLTMNNYGALSQYHFIHQIMRYWSDPSRALDHEGSRPFSQMREVCLYKNDDTRPSNFLSLRTALPYLKYNFITHFIGHGVADASFKLDNNTVLTTESVAFYDCRITNATLKRFLGSFGSLKKLQWTDENAVSVGDIFGVIQDAPGLKGHLEELIIDNASNASTYTSHPSCDWKQFRNLKAITVDSASMFGVVKPILETDTDDEPIVCDPDPELFEQAGDTYNSVKRLSAFINALPTTLETLKITKCQSPIFDCALRIISHKKNTFHKLKQMTLVFDDITLTHRRAKLDEYVMIARKNSVKLILLGYRTAK